MKCSHGHRGVRCGINTLECIGAGELMWHIDVATYWNTLVSSEWAEENEQIRNIE